jgi:hypothetical protein
MSNVKICPKNGLKQDEQFFTDQTTGSNKSLAQSIRAKKSKANKSRPPRGQPRKMVRTTTLTKEQQMIAEKFKEAEAKETASTQTMMRESSFSLFLFEMV